jgi:phosphoribosylglycinamide formyltransferase-1
MTRLAILASGAGSNLEAIRAYLATHPAATVALVASDRPKAGALERAAEHGIETSVLADPEDGAAMAELLQQKQIDLIALAGYLRHVPDAVTHRYRGRILNIHPSLLPAFGGPGMYGHRVHEAVIAAGVRVSGATVHFVDEHYDRGPIVAQWPVPVTADDTPDSVAERVLRVEHRIYPRAIAAVARGHITLGPDGRVLGSLTEELPPFAP